MVKAIVGANWGDEGKGKITDVLAAESDVVVRFQGGSNAGHTIMADSVLNLVRLADSMGAEDYSSHAEQSESRIRNFTVRQHHIC